MDPITHILAGTAIGRAGLNRKTGLATVTLALAAELPDIDVVLNFAGPVVGFANHRGYTHTFIGVPFVAAASVGIVYGGYRFFKARGRVPKLPPRWGLLYLFAVIGALSHILLDFTNNYGVRPLAPFDHHWYAWDIVYIIEPLVTAPLLLALIVPWFAGLISGEVGARRASFPGRPSSIAALIFIGLLWWVQDFNHRRAIAMLNSQTYEDQEPIRVAAGPYMMNPFKWLGVVETETLFTTLPVHTRAGEVDPQRLARVRYKPDETPVTLAAKSSALGRVYLDWARFPYTEAIPLDPEQGITKVRIRDLRYDYPDPPLRLGSTGNGEEPEPPLSMSVELDAQLRILEVRMGRHVEKR